MKKLPLVFRRHWETKENEIKELSRKHHTIVLDSVKINGIKLLSALNKVGSNVRHLELDEVEVTHVSFRNIVNNMKKLETLTISESVLNEKVCEGHEPSSSTLKLKSLIIIRSSWAFLKILSDLRVTELKMMSMNFQETDREPFETFVLHQSELKSLAIYVQQGEIYRSLARFENIGYPFKLKKLSVDFKFWGDNPAIDDCFIAFLGSHSTTLEDLETRRNLSDKILEFIMKNLKVKRLMTSCTNMPTSPLYYNAIRQNQHLKSLILTEELNKVQVARGLMHIYQGINKLVIKCWTDEVTNEVFLLCANNLKRLSHLEVPSFTTDTPELPIPTLKTFKVDFVDDVQQWQTFCVNNPSIEHLSVKWLTNRNIFTYEVLNDVTSRLLNLKRITFGAYFNPTARILEALSRNCLKLEKLEVFSTNFHHPKRNSFANPGRLKLTLFKTDDVSFYFPEEESMWDEVEKNYILESEDDVMSVGDSDSMDEDDDGHEVDWEGEEDDLDFGMGDHDDYEYGYPHFGPAMFFFG